MPAAKSQQVLTKLHRYSNNIAKGAREGGNDGNSLLHEVQKEEGDKEPAAGDAQESQTCHPRCLPGVRHKSIQNREALGIYSDRRALIDTRAVVPVFWV